MLIDVSCSPASDPGCCWGEVVNALESGGVATIQLPDPIEKRHAQAFAIARKAIEKISTSTETHQLISIPDDADSAHVTGYHGAGTTNSLSRYNQYREGFVFSNENASLTVDGLPEFETKMKDIFESMHHVIASQVLTAFEKKYDLPPNWFESELGPTSTSSQWHIKRYVDVVHNADGNGNELMDDDDDDNDEKDEQPTIVLPMHTDPSIISVVIHDAPGTNPSALGLQYQSNEYNESKKQRIWKDVPYHGHAVATIFVGSVLSYITDGLCQSVKHRVIRCPTKSDDCTENHQRMAATLFVRPQLSAKVQVPPSPTFINEVQTRKKDSTFGDWYKRVSKNYSKNKKSTK